VKDRQFYQDADVAFRRNSRGYALALVLCEPGVDFANFVRGGEIHQKSVRPLGSSAILAPQQDGQPGQLTKPVVGGKLGENRDQGVESWHLPVEILIG
jgi:hypothetical protein